MLLVLAIGSAALAVTRMAAWWVIVPPSFMLLGYVALLREAAKADAERREVTPGPAVRTAPAAGTAPSAGVASAATRPAAPAATRTAAPAATRTAAPPTSRPAVPAAPAAPPAPAPAAQIIDISASLGQADEEFYDQYKDAKRRAVGDLTLALAG